MAVKIEKATKAAPKRSKKAKEVEEPKTKRGAKVVKIEDAPKLRKAKAKAVKEASDEPSIKEKLFNAYEDLDEILDVVEKEVGLSTESTASRTTTSTGLLTLDLMLSGGLVAKGWYTFFGGEQSSKSTLAMTQLARAAVSKEVPILLYFDFEGSYDPEYMLAIAKSQGFKGDTTDLFGIQDEQTGKYIKKPIIRRYAADVAERFFDMVYKLQKRLPDKLFKYGRWWYVYEDDKANAKYRKEANEKLLRKTGKLWVEAENGNPQALIVLDSYPAMLPERMDDDDPKAGIGAQARMFSDQIKRIKGRMSAKRMNILGINQLRLKPLVMMGNPEYEPGGESLKFYSDCRIRMAGRAVPAGETRQEGQTNFAEEPSIEFEGTKDIYRFVHMRAHKNKLSVPNLEGWARIWVRDGEGQARGYDPVYDSLQFLKSLALVSGTRNKLKIEWAKIGVKGAENAKSLTHIQFKTLIVGNKKQIEKVLSDIKYTGKAFKLREKLFSLFKDGKAQKMYFEAMRSKKGTDESGSDADSDD